MGCHFLLQGIFLTQGLNDGSCIFTPEPSGKPYLSCSEAKKKTKKTKTKIKTSNPLQQKTTKKRSPALFNFHLLPPRFLTPLQLSILLSTVLSPRSPSLHTALPSLPFFLNLLGLAGEGERENTGGLEEHRVRVSCLGSLPTSAWS